MQQRVINLEKFVGKVSPLGFTPLLSGASNQILKYDFKGVGPRVFDKSGNGNGGLLKPNWPKNAPRREPVLGIPLGGKLVFDGEDDYVKVSDDPSLDVNEITIDMKLKPREWEGDAQFFDRWAPDKAYLFRYDSGTDSIEFWLRNEADDREVHISSDGELPPTGEVTTLRASYDGETMKMLFGNRTVASMSYTEGIASSTEPLWIGGKPVNGRFPYNFNGEILSVSVRNVGVY